MLTGAQFTTQLRQINRYVYLGGPSRARTQSSMLPTLNAINTFAGAQTGANLLAVMQAIENVPAPKKIQYANALNALYASFPSPIYVTVGPFTLNLVMVAGIGVPRSVNVHSHQTDAVIALHTLDGFVAGHNLLVALCQEVANGHRVGVTDASNTASGGNECAGLTYPSSAHRTQLIDALVNNHGAVGARIAAAMTNMGHAPAVAGSYAWLEAQIDATPIYGLRGLPNVVASSTVHGPSWISAATLQGWVSNTAQFPAPLVAPADADAVLVLGAVLHAGKVHNAGGNTRVNWNAANLSTLAYRPPYIGLAHELVHALHNQRGDQAGFDTATTTGVLYEYQCVGLGSFVNEPISENTVRAGAPGVAQRDRYAT